MRKQIIQPVMPSFRPNQQNWFNLKSLAQVELTSEEQAHPIEFAFSSNEDEAWRAAQPGEQKIRIVFDEPQNIKQVYLKFEEKEQARTQEFQLRWLPEGQLSYQEIVRQQYNFSPPQTIQESEEYSVNLESVRALELTINPDITREEAYASLAQLQLS